MILDDPDSMQFVLLAILLLCSMYFSAAETALTSLSRITLRTMLDEGVKGAKDVDKITSNTPKLLSVILIGNNFANVASSAIATSLALKIAGDNSVVLGITTVIVTLTLLIFAEMTPKIIAVNHSARVSCFVAAPMRLVVAVLTPISKALNLVVRLILLLLRVKADGDTPIITETELKTMVNVSHEEGIIQKDERLMINNVFDFGDSRAKDIMVPRTDMAAVSVNTNYRTVMNLFKDEQFSRFPVYRGDADHIVGILHLKDIVFLEGKEKTSFQITKYMRQPYFSYELKPTIELFSEMRTESISMAVILDEYGGTSGIVTIEDLVEEIVGEIYDEYDDEEKEEKDFMHINDSEFTVDAGVRIDDFNELAGTKIVSGDYDSIGGFVVGLLGKIPELGESVSFQGLTFQIESVGKNRVEKLRIKVDANLKGHGKTLENF